MNLLLHAAIVASLGLTMQSAPPTQTRPRPRPRSTSTQIVVRDQSGAPVPGARVAVSGAATKEATTDAHGAASLASMRDGSYRLRFEREGFITLERDVTVRTGQPAEIDVVLNAAPTPPPPPSLPGPAPTPAPQAGASSSPGPPVIVSIPAFLDKNFIGRDPLKESVLGCTGDSTTRVLQIRDSLASHTHANLDEVIYVVAGDGTVRVGAQSTPIEPGSLSVIPRGVSHALERRGKNPLIVLSMLAGAPCQAGPAAATSR
jgi:mannose-6-phosphate isomerase-like protein (cupin superfamily)